MVNYLTDLVRAHTGPDGTAIRFHVGSWAERNLVGRRHGSRAYSWRGGYPPLHCYGPPAEGGCTPRDRRRQRPRRPRAPTTGREAVSRSRYGRRPGGRSQSRPGRHRRRLGLVGRQRGAGLHPHVPVVPTKPHGPSRFPADRGEVVGDGGVPLVSPRTDLEADVVVAHPAAVLDDLELGVVADQVSFDLPALLRRGQLGGGRGAVPSGSPNGRWGR